MADEKEKVLYEFQGDVSSLKKSTQQALGLLDKFQANMDKLNSDGIVKASQRAQSGFQNSINQMTRSITAVQKKLKAIGDVRVPRGTAAFDATKQATDTLTSTLKELNSSNTITSKSLGELKANLNKVTEGLKSAGPSFDALIAKEEKFQSKLASIEKTANKFSSKVYGATDKVQGAFNKMGTSVGAKLNALGAKFQPIAAKIQGFKDKAVIAGNRVAQVFSTVAAAFRRTSDGTEGASRSQSRFGKVLDSIKEKLNNHQKELKETADANKNVEKASKNAYSSMSRGAEALSQSFGIIRNAIGGIVDSFFALAGVQTGDLLSNGAKGAIDYVENLNLFQVAMGASVDKGKAFVSQMQEVYGMDPSNLYRYTGYFYQLTDAIGMSEDASATMSLSMTKAANDLASLFNTDIQSVVDDLASGMQGMSRSVRKYGMDIRATTLEQTALKYGLEGNVETMSEADRQALRYITMLEQAQNALHQTADATADASGELGDFARNIESPANQLRIFKEQMAQLGRAIGNFIVAPLSRALPYINGFIMALRTMVNAFASVMGISVAAGNSLSSAGDDANATADGLDSIGDAANKTSKKLKQLIAPFDELNVLQESSGDSEDSLLPGTLDPTLAKALSEMELNLENISMKANKVRDDILGFLGLKVTTDPITQEQVIEWDRAAFMSNVMGSLDSFKAWFDDLSPIVHSTIMIAGVIAGISTVGTIASNVSAFLPVLSGALSTLGGAFGALTSPVGLVVIALAALLTFSEDFRTAFVDLFTQVGNSLVEWGNILGGVFSTVGTDLTTMWDTHIQPTIEAIGSMLAPALETLGSLWENLSNIISDIFTKLGDLWTTFLKPLIEGAMQIIQDLCAIIQDLWEQYIGPVVEYIGDGIENLWNTVLSPIIDKVIGILGKLWELIMALWTNVLEPIIVWFVGVLGPAIEGVFTQVWDIIEGVCTSIGGAIEGVLQIFEGIVDFLTGVFTGDWERAWKGIVNIFVGIGNTLISIFELVINAIIGLINGLVEAIWQGIQGAINIALGAIEGIADFLGWDINIKLNAQVPDIPYLNIPRIPEMATGGVVTGPTHLIAGEGKYSEAILPLDDSPQMNDLINKIVDAINKDDPDNSPQPVEVKVYIGDKEYDAFTYKASERGRKIVGKQPIKIGG